MKEKNLNIDLAIKYLQESSLDDQKAMNILFDSHLYHLSLFMGHLSVEKYLKALYVKQHSANPPFTHNLFRLAELCVLDLDDKISDNLDSITSFNIEARYDDYKKEFYNKCTKEFTENWINIIKEILDWLKLKL